MKILSQRFRAAIDYLSAFAGELDPIVVRPSGRDVIFSATNHAHGEYRCEAERPLDMRFAMMMQVPSRLAKLLPDDIVLTITSGSAATIRFDGGRFICPLHAMDGIPDPPRVSDGITIEWDARDMVPELVVAAESAVRGRSWAPKESISIEVLPARDTIVATDGRLLSVYHRRVDEGKTSRPPDLEVREMVHRMDVRRIVMACRSMGTVRIRSGRSHMLVECGRRLAIVPLQEVALPSWREAVKGVREIGKKGKISVDRDAFIHALRSISPDAEYSSGGILISASGREMVMVAGSESDGSVSRAVVGLQRRCALIPGVFLGAKYLLGVASHWPDLVPLVIEYRGAGRPVVFARDRYNAILAPMCFSQIERERDGDVSTVVTAVG